MVGVSLMERLWERLGMGVFARVKNGLGKQGKCFAAETIILVATLAMLLVGCSKEDHPQSSSMNGKKQTSSRMDTHMEAMKALKGSIPGSWSSLALPAWTENAEVKEMGSVLFAEHCSSCHGVNGRGDGPIAKQLALTPVNFVDGHHTDLFAAGEKFWIVTHGIEGSPMPSFMEVLSDKERWQVVAYILSLRADGAHGGD